MIGVLARNHNNYKNWVPSNLSHNCFLHHPHQNQAQTIGSNGWDSIFMIIVVSSRKQPTPNIIWGSVWPWSIQQKLPFSDPNHQYLCCRNLKGNVNECYSSDTTFSTWTTMNFVINKIEIQLSCGFNPNRNLLRVLCHQFLCPIIFKQAFSLSHILRPLNCKAHFLFRRFAAFLKLFDLNKLVAFIVNH